MLMLFWQYNLESRLIGAQMASDGQHLPDHPNYAWTPANPPTPDGESLDPQKIYADGKVRNATTQEMQAAKLYSTRQTVLLTVDMDINAAIESGFTFDGHKFSCSERAQINLIELLARAARGISSLPATLTTLDNQPYAISDGKALNDFADEMFKHKHEHLAKGRERKAVVLAAKSLDDLARLDGT